MILVKRGQTGRMVVDVQTKLTRLGFDVGARRIDGVFGPETEKAVRLFQGKRGLDVDGVVGPDTWREMVEATYRLGERQLYLREPPFRGDDVREVQATLNNLGFNAGRVNGVFGTLTDKAVREFQRNTGLPEDGIIGEETVTVMDNLKKRISSGGITGVWERGRVSRESELFERRVVIGWSGDPAIGEVAAGLSAVLQAEGAKVLALAGVVNGEGAAPGAEAANEFEADVLLWLEPNTSDDVSRKGTTCYYFDNGEYFSSRSKQIAEIIQSRLCAGLGLFDNGVEGKNLVILRATKMPAVVIRPLYGSHGEEKDLMKRKDWRETTAKTIAGALRCYWQD